MERLEFPQEIMIEATNHCNNRCFFCASPVSDRPRGYIETDLAVELIKKAYDLGCKKISFHGMGEPFLHKDLGIFVETAKKEGYEYIYLDSNGTIAGKGVVEPVLDAGLDSLKFSIHAATSETFKKITDNDSFDRLMDNAKYISQYIREHKLQCKTIAYFALSKINETEEQRFKCIMSEIFSDVWVRPIHNGSGVRKDNEKYAIEGKTFAAIDRFPCKELSNRMIINWEGKAIACSTDWTGAFMYGDARQERLDDLWNNPRINAIRLQHQKKETLPPICASCMGY